MTAVTSEVRHGHTHIAVWSTRLFPWDHCVINYLIVTCSKSKCWDFYLRNLVCNSDIVIIVPNILETVHSDVDQFIKANQALVVVLEAFFVGLVVLF